jgi:hypothetical protein
VPLLSKPRIQSDFMDGKVGLLPEWKDLIHFWARFSILNTSRLEAEASAMREIAALPL